MLTNNFLTASMSIRCSQCGANNHSQNHLCLACGADLTQPRESANAQRVLTGSSAPLEAPVPLPVDDPSALASAAASNELAEDVRYLFQGEPQSEPAESHANRYLLLVLLGLVAAAAGWHWRDVRSVAGRLSTSATAGQSTAISSASPASSSPSAPVSPSATPMPQSATPQATESAPTHDGSSTTENPSPARPQEEPHETESAVTRPSKPRIRAASQITRVADTEETEGEKYLYGDGVPVDCDRAQKDLLAAAKHSSAKAESELASMYATGHCAIRDLPLAYRWFNRAQQQNPRDKKIAEEMTVLLDQMSQEEKKLATR
jgi:hypothetical protein